MRPALVLLLLALLAGLAVRCSAPPAPRPIDAPEHEFSAARAARVLAAVVGDGSPHPCGAPAHDRVREVVAGELTKLGLAVERQTRFTCGPRTCANVTNLLARIPGRVGANAVLLTAHYDSVAAGPGASVDGMGVATVLESARAIVAAAPLRRPVWILLTDGEELGLLGAKAFVRDAALSGQVGVVVNVEARGTRGPSLMFETSAKNAGLVRVFAASTDHPVASSLFPTLYALLPNDTDLSVYKAAGLAGLNYAIIGGAARYHTPKDDLAHADPKSLQHHGDGALAVVRGLASGATPTAAEDDLVFFDVLGAFVVRWPARASVWASLAVLATLLATARSAAKARALSPGRLVVGAASALAIPAAGALGWSVTVAARAAGAAPAAWVAHPSGLVGAALAAGALGSAAIVTLAARYTDGAGTWWGAGVGLAAMAALTSLRAPGLSFFFLAPAGAAAMGTLAWTLRPGWSPARRGWLVTAMPAAAVLVWAPTLGLLYDGLGARFLAALSLGAGLVVWTCAPLLASLPSRARHALLAGLTAATAVAWTLAKLAAPFDADVPAHVSVRSYSVDGTSRDLLFAADGGVTEALARAFPAHDAAWPWSREEPTASTAARTLTAPAPPRVDVLAATATGEQRRLVLRLRSSRGASVVGLALRPGDDVRTVAMQGETLSPPEPVSHRATPWPFYECVTTPGDGVEIALDVGAGGPVHALVYDRTPGLDDEGSTTLTDARGPFAVPYGAGDYTIVAHAVEL